MTIVPEGYRVFDAEATGLLYDVDKCHCVVVQQGDEFFGFWDEPGFKGPEDVRYVGSIEYFLKNMVEEGWVYVGHNIMNYDLPMFKKLYKELLREFDPVKSTNRFFDSFLGSCMLNPEQSSHSVDYYGKKYGIEKPAHEDWSKLTYEMIVRCREDVKIQAKIFVNHLKRFEKYPKWFPALHLEQQVAYIHAHQGVHGVRIDIIRAYELLKYIDRRINVVKNSLLLKLPKVCEGSDGYKNTFKKDGSLTAHVSRYFESCGKTAFDPDTLTLEDHSVTSDSVVRVGGPFSKVSFRYANLNSHDEIKEILYGFGWQPTEWNYKKDKAGRLVRDERRRLIKTSPKITEDSFDSLPPGLGQEIAEYLMLCHRRRFIANEKEPWKKGAMSFVRPNGYAPADGFTCGTNTSRYRHFGILVNLPRPSTVLGPEIRSIFTVPRGHKMLGIDLAGIEARVMAHFAYFYDGGDYAKVALDGDVHDTNAKLLGVDRDTAKSFLYAISYGAGPAKLASILGVGIQEAKELIELYWDTHSGLRDFIQALEKEFRKTGRWITGLDGRKLYIRSEHKLLNTAVQNAATIIFKKWMVKCWYYQQRANNHGNPPDELHQIIAYHDELEFDCYTDREDYVEIHGKNLVELIEETGEEMKLKVPLTGDYKIGDTYTEVH